MRVAVLASMGTISVVSERRLPPLLALEPGFRRADLRLEGRFPGSLTSEIRPRRIRLGAVLRFFFLAIIGYIT